jgi:hypothetical protein
MWRYLNKIGDEKNSELSIDDVFAAYFALRKNKRRTPSALRFELDFERRCVDLHKRINARTYHPGRSAVFIVSHPIVREIFAPAFEDRIIDMILQRKLVPLLERFYITDSYSIRKGKGVLFAVKRVAQHIRKCSKEYTQDCYILKLDLRSYFMSLNKEMCLKMMTDFVYREYKGADKDVLISLIREVILDCPQHNCQRLTPPDSWLKLPWHKSLFNVPDNHGLPIGRMTSQICAMYVLVQLDKLITKNWGVRYYGRYMDDMVLIHRDRKYLLQVEQKIKAWLAEHDLSLHPHKRYLQHYTKGVKFVGVVIKPWRKYISNRTVSRAVERINHYNQLISENKYLVFEYAEEFAFSLNSFLGMISHYDSYNVRVNLVRRLDNAWWRVFYFNNGYKRVSVKKRFRSRFVEQRKIHIQLQNDFTRIIGYTK